MKKSIAALVLCAAWPASAQAQNPGPVVAPITNGTVTQVPSRPAPDTKAATPLKVTVVLTRNEGEKQVSRMPFTLLVNAGQQVSANMGIQVAVPQTVMVPKVDGQTPMTAPATSFTYKQVGHNLTINASSVLADGRFNVELRLEDSGVVPDKSTSSLPGTPSFSSFTQRTLLAMRDGQTLEFASIPNPVNGEITRITVTLDVLK